ncbi:MAG: FAD-dependent oxidoreductase [Candidatus Brocadiales bacterium]
MSKSCGVGKKRAQVVILGAGPAGLTAAWKLSKEGVRTVVLEQSKTVGGLCRTVEHRGFRFDLGGHRFISEDTSLVEAVQELMGEELLLVNRKSAVRLMGQEFCYPLQAQELLRKLDAKYTLRCLWDCLGVVVSGRAEVQEDTSLEDWLMSNFGLTLYQIFFKEYTTKLWGVPPRKLSGDWAVSRIPVLNLWDALLRIINIGKDPSGGHVTRFFYPKRGIGQIFEFMARDIESRGGKILLNSMVKKVLLKGGRVEEIIFNCAGREGAIAGHWVISTLPLPVLVQCLDTAGTVHKGLLDRAGALSFRSLRFLNLLIDKPAISDNTWMYVPEKRYIMTRIQEPRHRSPFNCPEGKTSLILEIPCNFGDGVWHMEDGQLLERCLRDLSEMGIEIRSCLIDFFSTRARYAYPVYSTGYQHSRRKILGFLYDIPNLLTCGRGGLFKYLFMDQAMSSGLDYAECVLGGKERLQPLCEAQYLVESRSVI